MVWFLCAATPASAQNAGAGKADLSIVVGGWVSFAEPETRPEPAFSEYVVGGIITFAPISWLGVEGELLAGLRRSQALKFGSTQTLNTTSPPVFMDAVNLVIPFLGDQRPVVPFVTAGLGETTINRTRDVGQADTETFFTGNFGGGVKWYTTGRWGFRVDYRYFMTRSEPLAPGTFFGKEQRTAQRVTGSVVVKLIAR
jgi:opacity protein-like surface antigen